MLHPCSSCRRHVEHTDGGAGACPFCGAEVRAPQRTRGALLTLASAGFAATLNACYGAPSRYHERVPEPPAPQLIGVSGDPVEAARGAIERAKKEGCEVVETDPPGGATIHCPDMNARIAPRDGGILLSCGEPYETCRVTFERLLAPPVPPIEPIPPPP